jgi:hypothetical protein
MKNCLIVLVVLAVCLVVAAWLAVEQPWGVRVSDKGVPYMIATWRDYVDHDIQGLEVTVGTNQIIIDVPASPQYKRTTEQGHWDFHAFYVDSNVDSPAEVMVAHELRNEDLEVEIGRYVPSHPGKIVCVKTCRIIDDRPPYPVVVPGKTVAYPPPRGLIRAGMLQCDLDTLPWHADKIESRGVVIVADVNKLSDGKSNQNYFPPFPSDDNDAEPAQVYTYHSDRSDAPQLLVTVHRGRVIGITGGAEETADIPYRLPAPESPAFESPSQDNRTWGGWLWNLIYTK